MANLTYAQVRSSAIACAKEYLEKENRRVKILIYKDAGGDYAMKPILRSRISVSYTAIKSLVYIDLNGKIIIDVSRETISEFLQEMEINMIYCKFV